MSIAFGRWEERAPVGERAPAGEGRVPAGETCRQGKCAGGEKKRVAFSRRPVAQWD